MITLKQALETSEYDNQIFSFSDSVRKKVYGNKIFVRALIEFSNYCKNNCYYCGLRKDNLIPRYRLSTSEIMQCCKNAHKNGCRTFVLQSGEDPFFSKEVMTNIIKTIHTAFPDCAITLSIGEREREDYEAFFCAGAERYLLRQEAANPTLYRKLHPPEMDFEKRKKCLLTLKEIGFKVGAGFIVGTPFQNSSFIIDDFLFMKELKPDMIGVGPFVKARGTPFFSYNNGDALLALKVAALSRILFPHALIPATTALESVPVSFDFVGEDGKKMHFNNAKEATLCFGCNVVMVNYTKNEAKKMYCIYDNKKSSRTLHIPQGYKTVIDRGDVK